MPHDRHCGKANGAGADSAHSGNRRRGQLTMSKEENARTRQIADRAKLNLARGESPITIASGRGRRIRRGQPPHLCRPTSARPRPGPAPDGCRL